MLKPCSGLRSSHMVLLLLLLACGPSTPGGGTAPAETTTPVPATPTPFSGPDEDRDGWSVCPDGYEASQRCDCDDTRPDVHPGAAYHDGAVDHDCDGQLEWFLYLGEGKSRSGLVVNSTTYVTLQDNDLITLPLAGESYARHPLPADRYFSMLIGDGAGSIYALATIYRDEGTMDDVQIVRLSTTGEFLEEIGEPLPGDQEGHRMIRSPDGGFVVLGRIPDPQGNEFLPWLAQFSEEGHLEWQVSPSQPGESQRGYSVVALSGGDYLSSFQDYDTENGDLFWVSNEGEYLGLESPAYVAFDLATVYDGGYIVVGLGIDRLEEAGDHMWEIQPDQVSIAHLWAVEPVGDGTYVVAGAGERSPYEVNIYLTQFQVTGEVLWERYYYISGSLYQEAHTALPTPDGGFLVIGNFDSYCPDPGCHGPWKGFVYKVDSEGHGPEQEVDP